MILVPVTKSITFVFRTGLFLFRPSSCWDSWPSYLALSSWNIIFQRFSRRTLWLIGFLAISFYWNVLQSSLATFLAAMYSVRAPFNFSNATSALRYWPGYSPSLTDKIYVIFLLVRTPIFMRKLLSQETSQSWWVWICGDHGVEPLNYLDGILYVIQE